MGVDEWQNQIYFIGFWNCRRELVEVLETILSLNGIEKDKYMFIDAFSLINFSTKLGGALSKRFCLTKIGRKFSVWGIQRRYFDFVKLVKTVKRQARSMK